MSETPTPRGRIRKLLKMKGPQTAQDLAEVLGVTTMAVRQHLQRLVDGDEVSFTDRRQPVGRPRRVWQLTESGDRRFADTHVDLAVELIEAVEASLGRAGMSALIAERTKRQLQRYRDRFAGDATLEARVATLAEIRSEEGYMAQSERDGDTIRLIENHCPICVAARRCPGLCAGELDLFQELLGPAVSVTRSEHILGASRRCVYEITAV